MKSLFPRARALAALVPAALGALAAFGTAGPAAAEARLDARYSASLIGVKIGEGAFVVEISRNGYSAAGSASISAWMKMVTSGTGSAAARGTLSNGKVVPASYTVTSQTSKQNEDIRMVLAGGALRELTVVPPSPPAPDRVPLTDEHRRSVVDPMSAAIMPVARTANPAGPEACNRTLPIHDGRHRYDLIFRYERAEMLKDVRGVSGPVAVCRVTYRPIAGHRSSRSEGKGAEENQDILVWLGQIADTRVLVPAKVSVATKMGTLVVQATRFVSEPLRASADPAAK